MTKEEKVRLIDLQLKYLEMTHLNALALVKNLDSSVNDQHFTKESTHSEKELEPCF